MLKPHQRVINGLNTQIEHVRNRSCDAIANFALDKSTTLITDQIDQTLAQMVELKKYVQMAWSEIQKPIQVSPETTSSHILTMYFDDKLMVNLMVNCSLSDASSFNCKMAV